MTGQPVLHYNSKVPMYIVICSTLPPVSSITNEIESSFTELGVDQVLLSDLEVPLVDELSVSKGGVTKKSESIFCNKDISDM